MSHERLARSRIVAAGIVFSPLEAMDRQTARPDPSAEALGRKG
ncbi:hypothetical protein [Pararhodobacter sp.]